MFWSHLFLSNTTLCHFSLDLLRELQLWWNDWVNASWSHQHSLLFISFSIFYLYKTLIHPIGAYAVWTWTILNSDVNVLKCLERKVLKIIYGPVYDWNLWLPKKNRKLGAFVKMRIWRDTPSPRIWLGHINRMEGSRMPKGTTNRTFVVQKEEKISGNGGCRMWKTILKWCVTETQEMKYLRNNLKVYVIFISSTFAGHSSGRMSDKLIYISIHHFKR